MRKNKEPGSNKRPGYSATENKELGLLTEEIRYMFVDNPKSYCNISAKKSLGRKYGFPSEEHK